MKASHRKWIRRTGYFLAILLLIITLLPSAAKHPGLRIPIILCFFIGLVRPGFAYYLKKGKAFSRPPANPITKFLTGPWFFPVFLLILGTLLKVLGQVSSSFVFLAGMIMFLSDLLSGEHRENENPQKKTIGERDSFPLED